VLRQGEVSSVRDIAAGSVSPSPTERSSSWECHEPATDPGVGAGTLSDAVNLMKPRK